MNKWLYTVILLPAFSMALLVLEVLRTHGLDALSNPLVLGVALMAGTAVIVAQWAAYSVFLSRFTGMALRRALFVDALCHTPLLLCLAYFAPGVGRLLNIGTTLFAAAAVALVLCRAAIVLHARWARLSAIFINPYAALGIIIALAALVRVSLIAANRFHGDEALYSYWGLLVASGKDIFLRQGVIVDKPPVFLYTLALFFRIFGPSETAARLPNIISSLVSIVFVYHIVAHLADRRAALLSALFLCLSPFDIQFAPTAFTDPLMVAFVLGSFLLALRGRFFLAGVVAGLAVMTKPTAVFFLPLLLVFAGLSLGTLWRTRRLGLALVSMAVGFLAVCLAVVCWDVLIRVDTVNFLSASAARYGGLKLAPAARLAPRLQGWLGQLRYLTGSSISNAALLLGMPLLLAHGWWRRREGQSWLLDWALVAFLIYYVAIHTLLSFSIWDRYMLGLAPVVAVLLARISLLPHGAIPKNVQHTLWTRAIYLAALTVFLCLALLPPTQVALRYGFPVGGDHGAFQGIDDVADYFRANARPGSIVFHRWLGWHYSFYMFGQDLEYYYYPDHRFVLDSARRSPDLDKYVVFPSWTSPEELSDVLRGGNWELNELYRTYRPDGTLSFTIYQIQPAEQ
ncbi:MAG: glycosyltransferase family 39 protein [Anaerolineae bacterium]|nr:glycosyltransferase family 39 protein [Anaerolineae bacterium]